MQLDIVKLLRAGPPLLISSLQEEAYFLGGQWTILQEINQSVVSHLDKISDY